MFETDKKDRPAGEKIYAGTLDVKTKDAPNDIKRVNSSIGYQMFFDHGWRTASPVRKSEDGMYHVLVTETLARKEGRQWV